MIEATQAYGMNFFYPEGDTAIGAALAKFGEFARTELDFLLAHALESSGTLVDLGANLGSICLPFARQRPGWRVVAVEAHRGLCTILAANVITNRCDRVEVFNVAAGSVRDIVDFPALPLSTNGNMGISSFSNFRPDAEPVLMRTLDELAPSDTRLVKIDVEGYESQVLRGATRTLETVRPIWLVEAVDCEVRSNVMRQFIHAGYDVFWFYAPWVTHQPSKGGAPQDPTKGDANVVAVPKGQAISWRLPFANPDDASWPMNPEEYPYLKRYGY